jgi:hypothetical protein
MQYRIREAAVAGGLARSDPRSDLRSDFHNAFARPSPFFAGFCGLQVEPKSPLITHRLCFVNSLL